jgi:hypothetical protein
MGIEYLENAARAAGFAMAADEPSAEAVMASTPMDPWRPGTVPLREDETDERLHDRQASFTDWVKGMVSPGGRSAPA